MVSMRAFEEDSFVQGFFRLHGATGPVSQQSTASDIIWVEIHRQSRSNTRSLTKLPLTGEGLRLQLSLPSFNLSPNPEYFSSLFQSWLETG